MKYIIYACKSSDSEDRQVLSIESQLKELRDFASKEGLEVVKEFSESRTAKEPGRPIFNQMLLEIEEGQAQGIIAWHPDRCARNSIDGGKIIHLIDQKIITDLKFPTYIYDNSPHGIFNLSLAFSFSKLYVDNLSQNVKRGIREKLRRGEFPGPAPRGYINNLKDHTIEPCPQTFELIKNIMEHFAYGKITIPEIRKELYQSGIKTRTGNPVCYSTIKDMLASPFYYGVFRMNGELHQGSHQSMISKETHDKICKQLTQMARSISIKEEKLDRGFLFSEIGECGECGYTLINDFHRRKSGKTYKYYRCSKRSPVHQCKQKAISENDLIPQIERLASEIAINDDWHEYSQNLIKEWRDNEHDTNQEQIMQFKSKLEANKAKLERLLDLQIEGGLEIEEYKAKKNKLVNQSSQIETQIKRITTEGSLWFEFLHEALQTSNEAHHRLKQKDHAVSYKILQKIGSNAKLNQQIYSLSINRPFSFFREVLMRADMCGSPKKCTLKNNLETQSQCGVGRQSRSRRLMPDSHAAVHEPERASGWRGERSEPSLGSGGVCECVWEWHARQDSNL